MARISINERQNIREKVRVQIRANGHVDFQMLIDDAMKGKEVKAPEKVMNFLEHVRKHGNGHKLASNPPPISHDEAKERYLDYLFDKRVEEQCAFLLREKESGVPYWKRDPIGFIKLIFFGLVALFLLAVAFEL